MTLEVPFGSRGPDARITAVRTANGAPVALNELAEPVQVTALLALGPGAWSPDSDARIELVFTGTHRKVFARRLERPAPAIIAHVFTVPTTHDDESGLPPGNYQMQVRLVMRDTTTHAISGPLFVSVR